MYSMYAKNVHCIYCAISQILCAKSQLRNIDKMLYNSAAGGYCANTQIVCALLQLRNIDILLWIGAIDTLPIMVVISPYMAEAIVYPGVPILRNIEKIGCKCATAVGRSIRKKRLLSHW